MKTEERINQARIRQLNSYAEKKGAVIYWMQRDQRVHDNWALLYAQETALSRNVPLYVVFCLAGKFADAAYRHFAFMIKGLMQAEKEFARFNIPFILLRGDTGKSIAGFVKEAGVGVLVTDFNPLKIVNKWKKEVSEEISIPFYEVDAHNIVPCFAASNKAEFGAYTIRPKIKRMLDDFLVEFPPVVKMKRNEVKNKNDWNAALDEKLYDTSVNEVKNILPGEDEGIKALQRFIDERFPDYAVKRNDPSIDYTSNLSPYFHFGQLAPQRAALAVLRLTDYPESRESFLEELIIRRELADNFCFYNNDYDSFNGFHAWAKETLNNHRKDEREYIYSLKDFEKGNTHDPLWNAAQMEMVKKGKMHGYMRMYWAKKILEWTKTPEDAVKIAVYLNDRYELDGRDPNGYTGIAWAIGGVHDRAWSERPVFGKVRYMNYNGCKRKFDVDLYINNIESYNEDL